MVERIGSSIKRRLFNVPQTTGVCDGLELGVCAESDENRANVVADSRFYEPEAGCDDLGGDTFGQKL